MLSSVWGELIYRIFTVANELAVSEPLHSGSYVMALILRMSPLHSVHTFTEAEFSVLELMVVGVRIGLGDN